MEINTFFKLIRHRQKTIWSFVVIILIISLIITFTQPLKFTSKSRLLVAQNTMGVDPYAVSRSSEYLGSLFSQVVYSGSFFNLVANSEFNIDKSYFNGNSSKQMKKWNKTVSAKSLGDTGIISISVYHTDPNQAKQITLAINDVLIKKNSNYQGLGNLVKVNVIDQPIVSEYPNKPNAILNTALALIAGFVFSLIYIYYFPEEKYAFKLIRTRRNRTVKHKRTAAPIEEFKKTYQHQNNANINIEHLENINSLIEKKPFENTEREEEKIEYRGDINNIINRY